MTTFDDLVVDRSGLVVVVVQDGATGDVAMVGYMNRAAWNATHDTGHVHFWSRSRQELWMKGETSGNTLRVRSIHPDCDGDALLIIADTAGAVCHTGRGTCFEQVLRHGWVIDDLAATITQRSFLEPDQSYTAQLLSDRGLAARKVLEEGGELAFALKDLDTGGAKTRVVEEAADLIYHLLVSLESAGVTVADVAAELDRRRSASPSRR